MSDGFEPLEPIVPAPPTAPMPPPPPSFTPGPPPPGAGWTPQRPPQRSGMATAGFVLGIIAIALSVLWGILYATGALTFDFDSY